MNILALGSDLTTYGLNLASVDCLYSTFTSPFVDQTPSTEPSFNIPPCYVMHPPSLKGEHLSKFSVETLFYMFYNMPKDLLQAYSTQELYRREWRFHGELKAWIRARTQQELQQALPTIQFVYFDVSNWETRPLTATYRGNLASGFIGEEEVRMKYLPMQAIAAGPPNGSIPIPQSSS